MSILSINNLYKSFGDNKVLGGVSFDVPENCVFGFLGRNGAGKTTTMKIILGLLQADSGNVSVCGDAVVFGQNSTNRYIGYLPDVPEYYGFMNAYEYLKFCGEITEMPKGKINARCDELLNLVGLSGVKKKIKAYSRGMKQRLGIAQALLNEPKLLLCDEPTSALDPVGRKEILDILQSVKQKTTVIFSTHILADIERICDRIAVIEKGNIVLNGTFGELKAIHKSNSLIIDFSNAADKDKFVALFAPLGLSQEIRQNNSAVCVVSEDILRAEAGVLEILGVERILPTRLQLIEPTIESLIMGVLA